LCYKVYTLRYKVALLGSLAGLALAGCALSPDLSDPVRCAVGLSTTSVRWERSVVRNGAGATVAIHAEDCADRLHLEPESTTYFLFLRRSGEDDDAQHLFFRYVARSPHIVDRPTVRWLDASHVRITARDIRTITRQRRHADRVAITYDLRAP